MPLEQPTCRLVHDELERAELGLKLAELAALLRGEGPLGSNCCRRNERAPAPRVRRLGAEQRGHDEEGLGSGRHGAGGHEAGRPAGGRRHAEAQVL